MAYLDLMILSVLLIIVFHEVGHALLAKKQGIFIKFSWNKIGPGILIKGAYQNKWDYLSGFFGSFLALPIWLFAVDDLVLGFFIFVGMATSAAIYDILYLIKYDKLRKTQLENQSALTNGKEQTESKNL